MPVVAWPNSWMIIIIKKKINSFINPENKYINIVIIVNGLKDNLLNIVFII